MVWVISRTSTSRTSNSGRKAEICVCHSFKTAGSASGG